MGKIFKRGQCIQKGGRSLPEIWKERLEGTVFIAMKVKYNVNK